MCPSIPQHHTVLATLAMYKVVKAGSAILLPLFFFLKIVFSILDSFYINFSIKSSVSTKHPTGILKGIAWNLYIINLGRMSILTMLNLPVYEHGMSPHLFNTLCVVFMLDVSLIWGRNYLPCSVWVWSSSICPFIIFIRPQIKESCSTVYRWLLRLEALKSQSYALGTSHGLKQITAFHSHPPFFKELMKLHYAQ